MIKTVPRMHPTNNIDARELDSTLHKLRGHRVPFHLTAVHLAYCDLLSVVALFPLLFPFEKDFLKVLVLDTEGAKIFSK